MALGRTSVRVEPYEHVLRRELRGPRVVASDLVIGEDLVPGLGGTAAEERRAALEDPAGTHDLPGVRLNVLERGCLTPPRAR